MNLYELTPQQRSDFAVDCFDRVYPCMSHFDPTGEFREAVNTARTLGEDNAAAQQFSRKFVRLLCKGTPSAKVVAAAKAGRECLQNNPAIAASLAVEASANPNESKWQDRHLYAMLYGNSE